MSHDIHGFTDLVRERSNPLKAGELCRLTSAKKLEGIKALQKSVKAETLKADLFYRDDQQRTPLSIALSQGDTQIVSLILSLGAAETIFVQGSTPQSILCTIPFSRIPPASAHTSEIGAKSAVGLKDRGELPSADVLYLVDESLERYIHDLAHRSSAIGATATIGKDMVDIVGATSPAAATASAASSNAAQAVPQAVAAQPKAVDSFQAGDRVRLRPGVTCSSLVGVNADGFPLQLGNGSGSSTLYCGRNMGSKMIPGSNGKCGPNSGPQCPSCAACSQAIAAQQLRAASKACLGMETQRKEGVVMTVKGTGLGSAVRVASIHTGHLCDYAAGDLLYADGSLPGPAAELVIDKPARAAGVPADWGAAHIAKVDVSSDSGSNGPQALADGRTDTYWESSGQPGTHYFQVTLSKPSPVRSFGILIDQADGSYCPQVVRVLIGPSASALVDLGPQSLPPSGSGSSGAPFLQLLHNCHQRVSVIRVVVERSGGTNCRIRGLAVDLAHPSKEYHVGDRVMLAQGYTGKGWNLTGDKVGVVVCAPYELAGGEQRCVMVSSLLQPDCYLFRSSWLAHAESGGNVTLRVGDMVQLDSAVWEPGSAMLESKCLDQPGLHRYGMVTGAGVMRDGVQRNVEVTTAGDGDGIGAASLYPGFALHVATPFSMLPPEASASLAEALRRINGAAGVRVDVEEMVGRFGLNTWSKVWPQLAARVGQEALMTEFLGWHASRATELLTPALAQILEKARAATATEVGKAEASESVPVGAPVVAPATWTCQSCKFEENPAEVGKCQMCGTKGKSWACGDCHTKNKVGAAICSFCGKPRTVPGGAVAPGVGEAADRADLEEELRFADPDNLVSSAARAALVGPMLAAGLTAKVLRTTVTEEQLKALPKPAVVPLGLLKRILMRAAALNGPPQLKQISVDGGQASVLFPLVIAGLAAGATEASLLEALSKHAPVVSIVVDRDTNAATAYFVSAADAAKARDGAKLDARAERPAAFKGSEQVRQYNCDQCTLLNDLDEAKCVACDSARPAWVDTLVADLTKEANSAGQADTSLVPKIPVLEQWVLWGKTAEAEAQKAVAALQNFNKMRRAYESRADFTDSEESSSSEGGTDAVDPNAEVMENSRLRDVFQSDGVRGGQPNPTPTTSPTPPKGLERQSTHLFYLASHYEPLHDLDHLLQWRDIFGSTSAHHAACMQLPRTLRALFNCGAAPWAMNKGGETPVALQHGLRDLSATKSALLRACVKGHLLSLPKSDDGSAERLLKLVLAANEDYATPTALAEVKSF